METPQRKSESTRKKLGSHRSRTRACPVSSDSDRECEDANQSSHVGFALLSSSSEHWTSGEESSEPDDLKNNANREPHIKKIRTHITHLQSAVDKMLGCNVDDAFRDFGEEVPPPEKMAEHLQDEYRLMAKALHDLEELLLAKDWPHDMAWGGDTAFDIKEMCLLQRELSQRDVVIKRLSEQLATLCQAHDNLFADREQQEELLATEVRCLRSQVDEANRVIEKISASGGLMAMQEAEMEIARLRNKLEATTAANGDLEQQLTFEMRNSSELVDELKRQRDLVEEIRFVTGRGGCSLKDVLSSCILDGSGIHVDDMRGDFCPDSVRNVFVRLQEENIALQYAIRESEGELLRMRENLNSNAWSLKKYYEQSVEIKSALTGELQKCGDSSAVDAVASDLATITELDTSGDVSGWLNNFLEGSIYFERHASELLMTWLDASKGSDEAPEELRLSRKRRLKMPDSRSPTITSESMTIEQDDIVEKQLETINELKMKVKELQETSKDLMQNTGSVPFGQISFLDSVPKTNFVGVDTALSSLPEYSSSDSRMPSRTERLSKHGVSRSDIIQEIDSGIEQSGAKLATKSPVEMGKPVVSIKAPSYDRSLMSSTIKQGISPISHITDVSSIPESLPDEADLKAEIRDLTNSDKEKILQAATLFGNQEDLPGDTKADFSRASQIYTDISSLPDLTGDDSEFTHMGKKDLEILVQQKNDEISLLKAKIVELETPLLKTSFNTRSNPPLSACASLEASMSSPGSMKENRDMKEQLELCRDDEPTRGHPPSCLKLKSVAIKMLWREKDKIKVKLDKASEAAPESLMKDSEQILMAKFSCQNDSMELKSAEFLTMHVGSNCHFNDASVQVDEGKLLPLESVIRKLEERLSNSSGSLRKEQDDEPDVPEPSLEAVDVPALTRRLGEAEKAVCQLQHLLRDLRKYAPSTKHDIDIVLPTDFEEEVVQRLEAAILPIDTRLSEVEDSRLCGDSREGTKATSSQLRDILTQSATKTRNLRERILNIERALQNIHERLCAFDTNSALMSSFEEARDDIARTTNKNEASLTRLETDVMQHVEIQLATIRSLQESNLKKDKLITEQTEHVRQLSATLAFEQMQEAKCISELTLQTEALNQRAGELDKVRRDDEEKFQKLVHYETLLGDTRKQLSNKTEETSARSSQVSKLEEEIAQLKKELAEKISVNEKMRTKFIKAGYSTVWPLDEMIQRAVIRSTRLRKLSSVVLASDLGLTCPSREETVEEAIREKEREFMVEENKLVTLRLKMAQNQATRRQEIHDIEYNKLPDLQKSLKRMTNDLQAKQSVLRRSALAYHSLFQSGEVDISSNISVTDKELQSEELMPSIWTFDQSTSKVCSSAMSRTLLPPDPLEMPHFPQCTLLAPVESGEDKTGCDFSWQQFGAQGCTSANLSVEFTVPIATTLGSETDVSVDDKPEGSFLTVHNTAHTHRETRPIRVSRRFPSISFAPVISPTMELSESERESDKRREASRIAAEEKLALQKEFKAELDGALQRQVEYSDEVEHLKILVYERDEQIVELEGRLAEMTGSEVDKGTTDSKASSCKSPVGAEGKSVQTSLTEALRTSGKRKLSDTSLHSVSETQNDICPTWAELQDAAVPALADMSSSIDRLKTAALDLAKGDPHTVVSNLLLNSASSLVSGAVELREALLSVKDGHTGDDASMAEIKEAIAGADEDELRELSVASVGENRNMRNELRSLVDINRDLKAQCAETRKILESTTSVLADTDKALGFMDDRLKKETRKNKVLSSRVDNVNRQTIEDLEPSPFSTESHRALVQKVSDLVQQTAELDAENRRLLKEIDILKVALEEAEKGTGKAAVSRFLEEASGGPLQFEFETRLCPEGSVEGTVRLKREDDTDEPLQLDFDMRLREAGQEMSNSAANCSSDLLTNLVIPDRPVWTVTGRQGNNNCAVDEEGWVTPPISRRKPWTEPVRCEEGPSPALKAANLAHHLAIDRLRWMLLNGEDVAATFPSKRSSLHCQRRRRMSPTASVMEKVRQNAREVQTRFVNLRKPIYFRNILTNE